MFRESLVRSMTVYAFLIASTIQGMTPDARTLVSPLALRWLDDRAGDLGLGLGPVGRPASDRMAPLDDIHPDGTAEDVVHPGEPTSVTATSRQRIASLRRTLWSTRASWAPARADDLRLASPRRPFESSTHPIFTLCRMIC